jgi:hypothetical protein
MAGMGVSKNPLVFCSRICGLGDDGGEAKWQPTALQVRPYNQDIDHTSRLHDEILQRGRYERDEDAKLEQVKWRHIIRENM